ISVSGTPGEEKDTERLIFRGQDTGCGIREEDIGKIFENFKQLDSKRNRKAEGTGLGLSITKHLVELMHGTIRVESVYGEGSTFIVEIPQEITDARPLLEMPEQQARKEEALEPFTAKDYRVLVVDDNLINRRVARSFLQSYRLEITEAESGPEAIELVKRKLFDIIFMDHMMPMMDGIEAVQKIRKDCGENGKKPVIIALTANAMEGVRESFLANGFQDFITKPIDRRAMHAVLLKWIPQDKRIKGGAWIAGRQSNDVFRKVIIEGIDTDEVAGHYNGSIEEYNELLTLYCLDGKRKLKVLQELWQEQDYEGYGIEVHALKSASANVGAMRLSSRAKEQEKAVNRGDLALVDRCVPKLLAEYEEQLGHIQSYLDENRKQESMAKRKKEIEREELLRLLESAAESLENFQAKECAQKVDELLECRLEADTEAALEKIKEQLRLYEDDAAEQMLHELLEQIR
ncbi:MAG: response regulator, partial [Lachnospiraceae bacterium]|nr:response regulator [Lachnospiraceae bacterium]